MPIEFLGGEVYVPSTLVRFLIAFYSWFTLTFAPSSCALRDACMRKTMSREISVPGKMLLSASTAFSRSILSALTTLMIEKMPRSRLFAL